ncbi:hypothetical protein BU16DRAFT_51297 [Lophium mytilinum]|uniref:Uncharacterized protein n=1 Tax=Lophium mytilinum TaxID=390894 RepID=A0A6A6QR99_9PEZI|nr:hypothetical protein BU16DRAFT_51297 [Lophium mytilinum]
MRNPSLERRCRGMALENRYRLCAHRSFTYSEFKDFARRKDYISCTHTNHRHVHSSHHGDILPCVTTSRTSAAYDCTHAWTSFHHQSFFEAMSVPADITPSKRLSRLTSTLNETDHPLCPHLHLKDDKILQTTSTMFDNRSYPMYSGGYKGLCSDYCFPKYIRHDLRRWASEPQILHCTGPACNSKIQIHKYRVANSGFVRMVLGATKSWEHASPTDVGWIAAVSDDWRGLKEHPEDSPRKLF